MGQLNANYTPTGLFTIEPVKQALYYLRQQMQKVARVKRGSICFTCDTIIIMAHGTGILLEFRLEPTGLIGRISCSPGLRPAPGQYLVATGPDYSEPLPTILYPTGYENDGLWVTGMFPPSWTAGTPLKLRGPAGNGFRLPNTLRRLALASLDGSPARLLPLMDQALANRAAVAIYTQIIPSDLPPEVEILPLDLLPEAPAWADFLALETNLSSLGSLPALLGLPPNRRPTCMTQVLILTAMPCSGLGDCGVCATLTRKGWTLACSDGPVYDYQLLEGV